MAKLDFDTVMGIIGAAVIKQRKFADTDDTARRIEHLRACVELQGVATEIYATLEDANQDDWLDIYQRYFT